MFSKLTLVSFVATSVTAVKIESDREPLLTWSSASKKSAHPLNYFVPNFGRDADVIGTINSEQVASK